MINGSIESRNIGGVFRATVALGGGVGVFGLKIAPNVLKSPTFVHGVVAGAAEHACAFFPESLSFGESQFFFADPRKIVGGRGGRGGRGSGRFGRRGAFKLFVVVTFAGSYNRHEGGVLHVFGAVDAHDKDGVKS